MKTGKQIRYMVKEDFFTLSLNLLWPIIRHIITKICKGMWNSTDIGLSNIVLFYNV